MNKSQIRLKTIFLVLVVGLTLFRVWLASLMNYQIIVDGGEYDDWLQVKNSVEILNGSWLGDYSQKILVKNESFPLFLALCRFLHLPYGVGYALFIIFASAIFVVALEPMIKYKNIRNLMFLFLIYHPIGLLSSSALRIYRNALVPWAVIGCCGCYLAIYLRRDKESKALLFWSICGGIYSAFFWLLREDSVWLLPFIVGVTVFCIIYWIMRKRNLAYVLKRICIILIPCITILASIFIIKGINHYYYGIALTNDRNQGEIARVNNLLYEIDDNNDNRDVWVSNDALRQAINVSPTLASIDNLEEAFSTSGWAPDDEGVRGDMCTWALRASIKDAGHFKDAVETQNFYKQIGDELEAAFDDGRLKRKDAILIDGIGGLYLDDFAESFVLTLQTMKEFAFNNQCDEGTDVYYVSGTENDIILAEELLLTGVPRTKEQLVDANYKHFNKAMNNTLIGEKNIYIRISITIIRAYQFVSPILLFISIVCYLWMIYSILVNRAVDIFPAWICATALILSAFVNIFVTVLFSRWMSRDPAGITFSFYAPAAYLLIMGFEMFCIYGTLLKVKGKIRNE